MKKFYRYFIGILIFALLEASCSFPGLQNESAPLTKVPEQTDGGSGPPVLIELKTVDLSGPPPGTIMEWVDGGSLVYVPGGEFVMGAGGKDNPEHTISLSPFWLHRTKVTNRMYNLCVTVGVCQPPQDEQAANDLENSYLRERPVVSVRWEEARVYCDWVQGTLPTEAQWEMTARGLENTIFPWGDAAPSCDLLNFNNCVSKTSRVFDYLNGRSSFNALDMAGNTFEWVGDWYDPDYYPNGPDINPSGPQLGTKRVVRGSSFASPVEEIPSSQRFSEDPNQPRPDLGFRCVVEKPQVFAPYCQSSAYISGDSGSTPPTRSCDVGNREISRECDFVIHEIEHAGELRSADGGDPLTCEPSDGTRVICSGPSGVTGLVSVVVTCGTVTPDSRLRDLRCILGYEPTPGSELHCEFAPGPSEPVGGSGEGGCPPDMFPSPGPGGTTLCLSRDRGPEILEGDLEPAVGEDGTAVPSGGGEDAIDVGELEPYVPLDGTVEPGGSEPAEEEPRSGACLGGMEESVGADGASVCTGTAPDGRTVECPAGTIPILTTEGSYVCIGRGGRITDPCPPGTYPVDGGGVVCMGAARETLPGGEMADPCIEGFTFDPALGCCQSPSGAYAGCSPSEYYDTVHGCQPMPDASGSILTVISFNVSTRICGDGVPGGDDPGGSLCSGLDKISCPLTPGCTWDFGTGICY